MREGLKRKSKISEKRGIDFLKNLLFGWSEVMFSLGCNFVDKNGERRNVFELAIGKSEGS